MHDGVIRWKQYALIVYLSEQLNDVSPQFGKTVLQKIIFILQEVYRVPCGYRYSLYSYGPYCSQLLRDLDMVEHLHGVDVCRVPSGFGGVAIFPGDKFKQVKDRGIDFIEVYKEKINNAVKLFGSFTARDLELRSTILYCCSDMKNMGQSYSINDLVSVVSEVKPKYSNNEIESAIVSLIEQKVCIQNGGCDL